MNKLVTSVATITLVVGGVYLIKQSPMVKQSSVSAHDQIHQQGHDHAVLNQAAESTEEAAGKPVKGHDHRHADEAGFDFTPYVSKEMADEIRPYTSRSTEGLEVKVDEDGNEYVDLKKRWSHTTISVVDENGVKHTGEWAPSK